MACMCLFNLFIYGKQIKFNQFVKSQQLIAHVQWLSISIRNELKCIAGCNPEPPLAKGKLQFLISSRSNPGTLPVNCRVRFQHEIRLESQERKTQPMGWGPQVTAEVISTRWLNTPRCGRKILTKDYSKNVSSSMVKHNNN